jgi:lauroyl/myristoyl acyltransferase
MSLSSFLQTPDILGKLPGLGADGVMELIAGLTQKWYQENPDERAIIQENLHRFNLTANDSKTDAIIHHIGLHYGEKFLPLALSPEALYAFLTDRIDSNEALSVFKEDHSRGHGILILTGHVGAIEFIVPTLSIKHIPLSAALKFSTERLAQAARARADMMKSTGKFGEIQFIEVGKPGTSAAMDMAAALRRKEALLTVFDEKTPYSIPTSLFGTTVWGGAGLQKLIAFAKEAKVYSTFMIREANRYRLCIKRIEPSAEPIAQMYAHLEETVKPRIEQWYFLHEEIPFVEATE